MTYDARADRHGGSPATRQSPAADVVRLTAAMLSDTADLATYARALRVWNGSASPVTLLVTPLAAASDAAASAVPITVPAGAVTWEPISIRRLWTTGSTGLAAALTAGTVEVLLVTV
jgi:hypothetical protein